MKTLKITIAPPLAFNEQGKRANNEDSIFPPLDQADIHSRLFMVCDGVGGAEKGEIASQIACQTISQFFAKYCPDFSNEEHVQKAVQIAQQEIEMYIKRHPEAQGMATTLALLHLHTQGATVAHIGDSRVYHIRNGKILYKTRDHTLVNEWLANEIITPEEAKNHPKKNVLVRALQGTNQQKAKAEVKLITDLQPNDYFLLCSDGVLEHLEDDTLCQILQSNNSLEQKIEVIKEYGRDINRDNYSAYLIALESVTDQPPLSTSIKAPASKPRTANYNQADKSSPTKAKKFQLLNLPKIKKAEATPQQDLNQIQPTNKSKKYVTLSVLAAILLLAGGLYAFFGSKEHVRTFKGHTAYVCSVVFFPDGRYALSGSGDSTLKLWDIPTGECLQTLKEHGGVVYSVAFSPNGRYALSASEDNTLKLWDPPTGRCLKTMKGHDNIVRSIAFSPDGRYALSGSDDFTLKLWDIQTGQYLKTLEGHKNIVRSVAFSPDGCYALSGSDDKTLKLWDLTTGQCLKTMQGHRDVVRSVAFSPNGRYALSGSDDITLKLWDLTTGQCLKTMEGHEGWINSVAISPDGQYALSGSVDKALKLWNIQTGQCLKTIEEHGGTVYSVAFSPDGRYALSGSLDKTLKLWDITK
ncbi:MAG: protein phosphatase 2C domain-containing protein [Cytophagales bacterium]|nr:protein phosphatase 2C domain-containing protein [Bernardetiaceae bacterium]MDW8210426.1 protein phosphatase 2C domain-containing protein [Cytophagales bacterium]